MLYLCFVCFKQKTAYEMRIIDWSSTCALPICPIRAVVLTNGDVDHVAGLLTLRERHPLAVYATDRVLSVLEDNAIFNVLNPAFVARRRIRLGESFEQLA